MKTRTIPTALLSILFAAAFAGCDEKIAEERKVDVKSDGTVVEEKKTVTEKPDGTIVEEKSKEVDRPEDRDTDTDVKVDIDKE